MLDILCDRIYVHTYTYASILSVMTTTLEGWYYCHYTEEQTKFVRDFVAAQAQMDVRTELRNGPRAVRFQISYSLSLYQAALPGSGDHPRISPSRSASEGPKVQRSSGPAVRQYLSVQCPCHYSVLLRGIFPHFQ